MNIGRATVLLLLGLALMPGSSGCSDSDTKTVYVPGSSGSPPDAFQALLPGAGEPAALNPPSFSWSTSWGAFSFTLQVSTDSAFSSLVLDVSGIQAQGYTPPSALAASTTHWWRVSAVNGAGATLATGAPRSFTTISGTNAWCSAGGDILHSGYNAAETGGPPAAPAAPAWSVALGGSSLHPVVVKDGRVFVTAETYFTASTWLWALDVGTGAPLWSKDFGDIFRVGHPAVFNDKVYVQQCDNSPGTFLWCFNASTGNLVFSQPFGAQWETYWAPIVVGGTVYANGGSYGGLYGWDATTGAQTFFSSSLEQYDEWSPAYADGAVYTFVAGKFRAHDPVTGAVQWTTSVTWNWAGWSMMTSPVLNGTHAFVIAPPALHAIERSTHLVSWSTAGFNYSGAPAVADGVVYAISGGVLHARNASTGAYLWGFAGDTALASTPVVAAGHVYVSSAANTYAVSVATGSQAWTAAVGGPLTVAANKLLVARSNGTLNAYSLTP